MSTPAEKLMPGGVNSPVRAFGGVGQPRRPFTVSHGSGAYLHTGDGRALLDYVHGWGSVIVGHAHPQVQQAIAAAAAAGAGFGMASQIETDYARLLCARSGLEMVRMVNSGTEACMAALRLARGHTGRDRFVKFAGTYHGHADPFLVAAGSGALTFGSPSSAGVPAAAVADTLVLPYNDAAELEAAFAAHGSELAAAIIEPIAGNMGLVRPAAAFMAKLAALCARHGAVLIADEVMTCFRAAPGLASVELFGIEPDLACLGKVIGGGLPAAAFGGRRELMEQLAPLGPVYQAGTLAGNPVALAAGRATLELLDASAHARLRESCELLCERLAAAAAAAKVEFCAHAVGGMAGIHFAARPPRDLAEVEGCDRERFNAFFHLMLERDVLLPPSMYEALFIGLAHDAATLELAGAAAASAFAEL